MHAKLPQSCPTLCDPMEGAHQAPLSTGFSRQEYWSGLPFPSPGDLPDPGIEPGDCIAGRFVYHWRLPEKPARLRSYYSSYCYLKVRFGICFNLFQLQLR